MGICLFLMPANTERTKLLESNEINESTNDDYPCIGLSEQNDSEIKWVKLHQMFDR